MSVGVGHRLLQAGGARGIVLLVSLAFTAFSSRIIFQEHGAELFGLVMFFATLQYLIPFADLGLGAVVMNEVAASREDGEIARAQGIAIRCFKILLALSVAVILTLSVTSMLIFPRIEVAGIGVIDRAVILGVVFSIMLNVPLSIGNRILIGLDKTHVGILFSVIAPPIILLAVFCITFFDFNNTFLFILWPLVNVLVNCIIFIYSLKKIGLSIWQVFRRIRKVSMRDDSNPIFLTAASMAVISIANPLIVGAHRFLLLSAGLTLGLAAYSVGAQIYAPLIGIVSSAATPLWARFAVDTHARDATKAAALFPLVGLCAAVLLMFGIPVYSLLVTGHWDYVPLVTTVLFAILLFVQTCILPLSMRFNNGRLLVVQAISVSLSCLISLLLGLVFVGIFDSAGPILATIIAVFAMQYIPLKIISRRI